jgi:hypothetical protein
MISSTCITPLPVALQEAMRQSGVWQPWCPVALPDLRLLTIRFIDFAGIVHDDGELIVHHRLAEGTAALFDALLAQAFPIHSIRSMHHFQGSDEASMAANNTSAFNCRTIAGSSKFSLHAYGVALDINPLQNPCLSFDTNHTPSIAPIAGWEYMNRRNQKPGMVEPILPLAEHAGYSTWGGSWTDPVDYHHFQIDRAVAETWV